MKKNATATRMVQLGLLLDRYEMASRIWQCAPTTEETAKAYRSLLRARRNIVRFVFGKASSPKKGRKAP